MVLYLIHNMKQMKVKMKMKMVEQNRCSRKHSKGSLRLSCHLAFNQRQSNKEIKIDW